MNGHLLHPSLSPTTVGDEQIVLRTAIGTEAFLPSELLDGKRVSPFEHVRIEPSVTHLRKLVGQTEPSAQGTEEDRCKHPLSFDDRSRREGGKR
jgi:hypothetical protein